MSWVDKAHKRNKIDKMIKEAMNRQEYQEARRYDMQQATLRALCRFSFVGCIYLEMVFRCKRKGLTKWLDFVKKNVEEIGNDTEFISASNKYYKENFDLDVMNYLGMKLENDD